MIGAILLLSLLLLCSCADAEKNEGEGGLKIVTTVFPQYDFAQKITEGTDAEITMLLKTGSEPHSYEPTPKDIVTLSECDLFIWVGGESEAWAEKIIETVSLSKEKALALTALVPLTETGDSGHGHYDEHVWTSPKNAVTLVRAIGEKLAELDPENAEIYKSNTEKYVAELNALDADFEALADKLEGRPLIVGDRFPFVYLTEAYGIAYASPFNGCSSHAEASAADIAEVIEKAKSEGTGVVFSVDFSNGKLAESIAKEAGAMVENLRSCHTVTSDELDSGTDYVALMRKNLEKLQEITEN